MMQRVRLSPWPGRLVPAALAATAIAMVTVTIWSAVQVRPAINLRPASLAPDDSWNLTIGSKAEFAVSIKPFAHYSLRLIVQPAPELCALPNSGAVLTASVNLRGKQREAFFAVIDPYRLAEDRTPSELTAPLPTRGNGIGLITLRSRFLEPSAAESVNGCVWISALLLEEQANYGLLLPAGFLFLTAALLSRRRNVDVLNAVLVRAVQKPVRRVTYAAAIAFLFFAVVESYFRIHPESLPQPVLEYLPGDGAQLFDGTEAFVIDEEQNTRHYRPHYRAERAVAGQYGPFHRGSGGDIFRIFRDTDLAVSPDDRVPFSYSHDAHGNRAPFPLSDSEVLTISSSFFLTPGLHDEHIFAAQLAATIGVPVYNSAQGGWRLSDIFEELDRTLSLAGRPLTVVFGALASHFIPQRPLLQRADSGEKLPAGIVAATLLRHPRSWFAAPQQQGPVISSWRRHTLAEFLGRRPEMVQPRLYSWRGKPEPLYFLAQRVSVYYNDPFDPKRIADVTRRFAEILDRHHSNGVILLIPTKYAVLAPLLDPRVSADILTSTLGVKYAALELGADPIEILQRNHTRLSTSLANAGAAHGIGVIDLLPQFRARAEQGGMPFFPLDSHWNQDGISIAARETAAWFARNNGRMREQG